MTRAGPHEMAYFRLVLEKIVERGVEALERESSRKGFSVGCPGAMNRMDLINLRLEMEGAHGGKLDVCKTEAALSLLESEKWLTISAPPDNDDDDSDVEEEGRKKRRKSSGRKSMRGTYYGLSPRCFMELGDFLMKCGPICIQNSTLIWGL